MKTLEQTGLTLLEAAHKVRAERADQRADMWRDEGAIVHLTYAMGKMRRIFQACTTLNGRSAQEVWKAELPDVINYLLFAAQLMAEDDLYGGWPWGFRPSGELK